MHDPPPEGVLKLALTAETANHTLMLVAAATVADQVMAHFWWQHVVPAKQELELYEETDVRRAAVIQQLRAEHEPLLAKPHPYTKELRKRSEAMVNNAPTRYFTKEETQAAWELGKLLLPGDEPQ